MNTKGWALGGGLMVNRPELQVLKSLTNDLLIRDEAYDRHVALALWAGERVDLVRKQILMAAFRAADAGKSFVQVPTVQISQNHLFDIRTKKPVTALKPLLVNVFQNVKIVGDALIIWYRLRFAGAINA
jgi:hypothetical protein